MEASQAGLAGDGQAQGGDDAGQQQAPDTAALAQQLEALTGGQEEMRQFLMSQPWQQAEAQEAEQEIPGDEPLDLSFLDPTEPGFDPNQVADRLGGLIDNVVEQRLQREINPLRESMDEQRRDLESRDLVAEFPEFGDPQIADQVVDASKQIAQAYGKPELANEPWFWRLTYMAGRAAESANEEGSGDPEAAHLEGGGGARPGGNPQVDLGEQIVSARRGRSVLPF